MPENILQWNGVKFDYRFWSAAWKKNFDAPFEHIDKADIQRINLISWTFTQEFHIFKNCWQPWKIYWTFKESQLEYRIEYCSVSVKKSCKNKTLNLKITNKVMKTEIFIHIYVCDSKWCIVEQYLYVLLNMKIVMIEAVNL